MRNIQRLMKDSSLIGKELSGIEFNKVYEGTNFYKFLKNDLAHYAHKYKEGLNEDIIPFNPNGQCSPGGLYFCEESKSHKYMHEYGEKLAFIEIPNDARVYIEKDKFKANKFIIKKIQDFNDVPDSFWLSMLKYDGYALQFIKKQTKEICMDAVLQNGYALQFVNDDLLTDEMCETAVRKNGAAIRFVKGAFRTDDLYAIIRGECGEYPKYLEFLSV